MDDLYYIDRRTGEPCEEKVYGRWALSLLYGNSLIARLFSSLLLPLFASMPFLSQLYGYVQRQPRSRNKIELFIRTFDIDVSEFADPLSSYRSFNDFFIRKLKPESRPIDCTPSRLTMPVDGRYLVFPDLLKTDGFYVKGQKFGLREFLQHEKLFQRFRDGAMVIARLCPTDYHRFHFPCEGVPSESELVRGTLYSVNPVALAKRLHILWENKRMITQFVTQSAGLVLLVEVGATCVGTIHQTYAPGHAVEKGDEKGFFSFGGSCCVLLFERGRVVFDQDLIENSARHVETKGLFGSSFATVLNK